MDDINKLAYFTYGFSCGGFAVLALCAYAQNMKKRITNDISGAFERALSKIEVPTSNATGIEAKTQ